MVEIEHSAIHLKLSPLEAISSKEKILEMQMNLLNLIKIFKNFKDYRKKEGIEKGKAVKIMHEILKDIENIMGMLPKKEEEKEEKNTKFIKGKKERGAATGKILEPKEKEEDGIARKLREIKEKLANLQAS